MSAGSIHFLGTDSTGLTPDTSKIAAGKLVEIANDLRVIEADLWIAYVDLVMLCMYTIYFLVMAYGWPIGLAVLTAIGGIMSAQYITDVNPHTLSGIGVSLHIAFVVVLGGMYTLLGPTVGTSITIALSEYLRIFFGVKLIGMAETIYGLMLMLFIIFLPSGIYGSIRHLLPRKVRVTV